VDAVPTGIGGTPKPGPQHRVRLVGADVRRTRRGRVAARRRRSGPGGIGLLGTVLKLQGIAYLVGGLIFGIALFRARVLARWAAVLLAVSGLASAALAVLPDAFYRLLAFPNAIAMIALGYSLWRTARTDTTTSAAAVVSPRVTSAGVK
jgi:hypothetical protein